MSIQALIGRVFGRLTVTQISPRRLLRSNGGTEKYVICACSCGGVFEGLAGNVSKGNTQSCGCLRREVLRKLRTTHGGTLVEGTRLKTKEYKAWLDMRRRCEDTENPYYGGRGVSVCLEWQNDFQAFLDHIGPSPSIKHSVDRKRVNGNYEPGNVRWATAKEQANNRRKRQAKTCASKFIKRSRKI